MVESKEKKLEVSLQRINVGSVTVKINGKTPLLMDKFPDNVKKEILDKQSGVAKGNKKKVRDTKEEIQQAIHMTNSGNIGYPVFGFKKGMMECTSFVGDKMFSKKLVSGAVKIMNAEDGLIPIKFKKQDVLQHNIGAQTKFTPQFHDWSCELVLRYDKNNISAQDIITLINYAGFYNGVGAWRPKSGGGGSGEYGMYEVALS